MYLDISVFYLYGKTTFKFYRKQETNKKTFAAYKNQRNSGKLLSICTYIHPYYVATCLITRMGRECRVSEFDIFIIWGSPIIKLKVASPPTIASIKYLVYGDPISPNETNYNSAFCLKKNFY